MLPAFYIWSIRRPFGTRAEVQGCPGFKTEARAGKGSQNLRSKQPGSSPPASGPSTWGQLWSETVNAQDRTPGALQKPHPHLQRDLALDQAMPR